MKLKLLTLFIIGIQISYAHLVFKPTTLQHTIIEGQGGNRTAVFYLKNEGNSTIHINSISTSCGCISVEATTHEFLPEASGKIICNIKNNIVTNNEITYNILIDTDSIDSSRITLFLKLTTKEICEISPRLLFWRKDSDNVRKKLSIKLK